MKITALITMTVLAGISPNVMAADSRAVAEDNARNYDGNGNALAAQQSANDQYDLWLQRAAALYRDDKFAAAAEAGKRALATTQNFPPNSPQQAIAHDLLADIYRYWGRWEEARANYARAFAIWEKQTHPDPGHLFTDLINLIGAALTCDPDAGAKLFRDRDRDLQRFRSGPMDDAKILLLRAAVFHHQKRYAEAAGFFRQALRILQQAPGADAAAIAELRYLLSEDLRYLRHYQESLDEARRAIASFEGINGNYPSLPMALNSAASALFSLGRNEESAQAYQRALGLATNIFGEESRTTAIIMLNYARVLRALKRSPEARAMNRRGRDAFERTSLSGTGIIDVQELRVGRP